MPIGRLRLDDDKLLLHMFLKTTSFNEATENFEWSHWLNLLEENLEKIDFQSFINSPIWEYGNLAIEGFIMICVVIIIPKLRKPPQDGAATEDLEMPLPPPPPKLPTIEEEPLDDLEAGLKVIEVPNMS